MAEMMEKIAELSIEVYQLEEQLNVEEAALSLGRDRAPMTLDQTTGGTGVSVVEGRLQIIGALLENLRATL